MTSYYSSSWGFPPWPVPDAQKKREKERREKRERRRDPRKEETYVGHLPQREGSLQDLLLLSCNLGQVRAWTVSGVTRVSSPTNLEQSREAEEKNHGSAQRRVVRRAKTRLFLKWGIARRQQTESEMPPQHPNLWQSEPLLSPRKSGKFAEPQGHQTSSP